MTSLVNKGFRELIIGGILSGIIFILGNFLGISIIHQDTVILPLFIVIHTFCFLLCWMGVSFLLYKFPFYQILGVLGILFLTAGIEYYFQVPENPITIPLLILFWMGMNYLIIPEFFKKYKFIIISLYGTVIAYYFIFRFSPNYADHHRFVVSSFLIISISFMVVIWGYGRWKWLTNLHSDKVKAELMLLKNQINPHFFFNTLNNLYGLAVEKSDKAPEMILKLSDIMRYTIYEGNADFVSLEDEVSYLEDYIELHKIRYHKKVKISMVKDISHTHQIAPILLVVPLENAFKHGVESLTENAFINIEIRTGPTNIFFKIKNNYDPAEKEDAGLGLDNLQKRLSMIYLEKHELAITKTANIYELNLSLETT